MRKYSLYCAWVVSCLALIGSLYYSEIENLEVCSLCWFQRIAMFPLPLILGIAAYRNFSGIAVYVLPQIVLGGLFSAYQILVQAFPKIPLLFCTEGQKCFQKFDIGMGPVSIPMLSFIAFLAIAGLLTIKIRSRFF